MSPGRSRRAGCSSTNCLSHLISSSKVNPFSWTFTFDCSISSIKSKANALGSIGQPASVDTGNFPFVGWSTWSSLSIQIILQSSADWRRPIGMIGSISLDGVNSVPFLFIKSWVFRPSAKVTSTFWQRAWSSPRRRGRRGWVAPLPIKPFIPPPDMRLKETLRVFGRRALSCCWSLSIMSSRFWSAATVVVEEINGLFVVDEASEVSEPPIAFKSRFASSRIDEIDSLLELGWISVWSPGDDAASLFASFWALVAFWKKKTASISFITLRCQMIRASTVIATPLLILEVMVEATSTAFSATWVSEKESARRNLFLITLISPWSSISLSSNIRLHWLGLGFWDVSLFGMGCFTMDNLFKLSNQVEKKWRDSPARWYSINLQRRPSQRNSEGKISMLIKWLSSQAIEPFEQQKRVRFLHSKIRCTMSPPAPFAKTLKNIWASDKFTASGGLSSCRSISSFSARPPGWYRTMRWHMIFVAINRLAEINSSLWSGGTAMGNKVLALLSSRSHLEVVKVLDGDGSWAIRSRGWSWILCLEYHDWHSAIKPHQHSPEVAVKSDIMGSINTSQSDKSTGPVVELHGGKDGSLTWDLTVSVSLSLSFSMICFWRLVMPSRHSSSW